MTVPTTITAKLSELEQLSRLRSAPRSSAWQERA